MQHLSLIRSLSSSVSIPKYAFKCLFFSQTTLNRPTIASTVFLSTKSTSPYPFPPNIVFRQAALPIPQLQSPQPRSLVLFFSWFFSQEAHLEKFRTLWLSKGYDVLTVRTPITEFVLPQTLLPRHSRSNALQILEFLNQKAEYSYQRIILQGASFGVYSLFTFIDQLDKSIQGGNAQSLSLQVALKALIIDSGGIAKEMPTIGGRTFFKNPILRIIFKNAILLYLTLTYPLTQRSILRIGDIVEENPLRLPGLILYSLDDEIVYYRYLDELIHLWKGRGILVRSKCWASSGHVMHFKNYPEEYSAEIDAFLKQVFNNRK